jgi:hypothetical protein
VSCSAEALITVTDILDAAVGPSLFNTRGLPGYTFERAARELWRSRFDAERNLIVVNNGHRDFVFATRSRALQLRYLMRLYVKELVLKNFRGLPAEQLMERMIELSPLCRGEIETRLKGCNAPCDWMEAWSLPRPYSDSGATGSGRQFLFHRPDINANNFASRPRRFSLHCQHLGPQRRIAPPSLVLQVVSLGTLLPAHRSILACADVS